jgi:hypothetical protein
MAKMNVILIDPATQTITEIQIEKGIAAIYAAMNCEMFECPVEFPNGDVMYCDEEGKLNREKLIGGFTYPKEWSDIIMNKALVIGTNPNTGDSRHCKSTINEIKEAWGGIAWVTKEKANEYLDAIGF